MTKEEKLSTFASNCDEILDYLPAEEILTQLAEEAAELSQAALKLRRANLGINPTPVSTQKALANLNEEIADVLLCVNVLAVDVEIDDYTDTMIKKCNRWVHRLREKDIAEAEKLYGSTDEVTGNG